MKHVKSSLPARNYKKTFIGTALALKAPQNRRISCFHHAKIGRNPALPCLILSGNARRHAQ